MLLTGGNLMGSRQSEMEEGENHVGISVTGIR